VVMPLALSTSSALVTIPPCGAAGFGPAPVGLGEHAVHAPGTSSPPRQGSVARRSENRADTRACLSYRGRRSS
jgi:hypothetical protein